MTKKEEAEPFIQKHQLQRFESVPWNPLLPIVGYSGKIHDLECFLVWAGSDNRYKVNNVATTASAVSAYASIAALQPDVVISAGTAGGFSSRGAQIGDVYVSSKCIYHHRRIPDDIEDEHEFGDYGLGNFRSPPLGKLAKRAGLKVGVVSTSDSLDYTMQDLQVMHGEGASVKEMEAAAIAWVCHSLKTPFFALKSITDIVDDEERTSQEEFYENLAMASRNLQTKLSLVLSLIQGKPMLYWRWDYVAAASNDET
mmetsp:Transcript_7121/g.11732  ORF Transcript_7121/g.11732 Transcript_7121/m.11732 type:complete len:255 (-) Transcript_7121:96-860(-)